MQQFKAVAKKLAVLIKKYSIQFFCIAKAFCKDVLPRVYNCSVRYLKKSPRVLAAIITVLLVISCTVSVAVATGATSAYAVTYNGASIAMVEEPSVVAEAEIFAANKLNNPECNSKLIKTELNPTFVGKSNLSTSKELADLIIANSENIVLASVLYVDGVAVAFGNSKEEINNSLDAYLLSYKQENSLENGEIASDIEIKSEYLTKANFEKLLVVSDYVNSAEATLSVGSVTTITVKESIPFETEETPTSSLNVGTKKIVKSGVEGSKEVTYKVYSINGKETKRTALNSVVLSKPTAQKVLVGTKRVIAADKGGDAVMLWPVKRVAGSYVSSYVGDGRGHKGMDIVAKAGTPIYAASAGTVTFSGWDTSGYGYKIIVKHSDTYETLYAHCSALYVKKGDVVARGETIGAVGTTGRSTGNHLHFEVRKNGKFTDPSAYIGRN